MKFRIESNRIGQKRGWSRTESGFVPIDISVSRSLPPPCVTQVSSWPGRRKVWVGALCVHRGTRSKKICFRQKYVGRMQKPCRSDFQKHEIFFLVQIAFFAATVWSKKRTQRKNGKSVSLIAQTSESQADRCGGKTKRDGADVRKQRFFAAIVPFLMLGKKGWNGFASCARAAEEACPS